jgi:phytoene dehydrogenase-like protein
MRDGHGMLSVFATTPDDLSAYGARNVYLYDTWDLDSLFAPGDGSHRFAFVTVPSAREGPAARGAHHAIGLGLLHASHVEPWWDTTTGARGEEYEAFKAGQAEALRSLMARAIPELASGVVGLEAATPLTLRDFALSEGGARTGSTTRSVKWDGTACSPGPAFGVSTSPGRVSSCVASVV